MPGATYSAEFKNHIVRDVIDKERTIAAVTESHDLVAQTVGVWVRKYREDHPKHDSGSASESGEITHLKMKLRETRMENEFLKKRLLCRAEACRGPWWPRRPCTPSWPGGIWWLPSRTPRCARRPLPMT